MRYAKRFLLASWRVSQPPDRLRQNPGVSRETSGPMSVLKIRVPSTQLRFESSGNRRVLDLWLMSPWSLGCRPDRVREMGVFPPAGNNVSVHMRNHVAQTGQIDFVRVHEIAQNRFGDTNGLHKR